APARLHPVISEVGDDGVVPAALVIELATAIVDQGSVGQESARSVLEITPTVAGELKYSGPSTLTFTPARPLAFGQKYHVELKKLETRDAVVEPPAGERWTRDFETPAFAFLDW